MYAIRYTYNYIELKANTRSIKIHLMLQCLDWCTVAARSFHSQIKFYYLVTTSTSPLLDAELYVLVSDQA